MKRVIGSTEVRLLECVSPVKDKWRIRWDVQATEDGSATYMEKEFGGKPSMDEIRTTVIGWYNSQTEQKILSDFSYQGHQVWLSAENQFNYKVAYDLSVQSGGETLPVTFKFGTDAEPYYHQFNTLEDLSDFYQTAIEHIQKTIADGWSKKNSLDMSMYK